MIWSPASALFSLKPDAAAQRDIPTRGQQGTDDGLNAVVVGQELCGLTVRFLRYIIHLRPQARVAHRKIVLGAMTGTVGAFASRLATSFVALDEGAAEDRFERGQLA